jgi:putative addiction module CopG family antidote
MATMNISLPDNLKSYVDSRVSKDGYGTASEYFRELIRQDQQRREREQAEREQLEKLREEVQAGLDALREGRFKEYVSAEELVDDVVIEGTKRLVRSKNGSKRGNGKSKRSGSRQ